MLEMAIFENQIFKIFWGSMPPDRLKSSRLRRSMVHPPFENPGSAPVIISWNYIEITCNFPILRLIYVNVT